MITRKEVEKLKALQVAWGRGWPASFSTNSRDHIWLWECFGWTPVGKRRYVRGLSCVIDEVADRLRDERPGGGRFFIDERGAYYKTFRPIRFFDFPAV